MTLRTSGVLLHPTSLPGRYGIGSLGNEAKVFVDWLEKSRQSIWQILPLGPTDFSHSPYQCYSAFAGNTDLIDLEQLVEWNLLNESDLPPVSKNQDSNRIDFAKIRKQRATVLQLAFENYRNRGMFQSSEYLRFVEENGWWLHTWALFVACKNHIKGKSWRHWPQEIRHRDPEALVRFHADHTEEYDYHCFLQNIFFKQWFLLKDYANKKNIQILGDIPLYVAFDSVDVWANQDVFQLDHQQRPIKVGGVPPDYFSETGQLWGNPLYDWEKLRQRNYDWWIARLHFNLKLFNTVRIDHFRGLESYWAIPFGEKTAVNGEWMKAYGDSLLSLLQSQIGHLPIVAEDLGTITPEVEQLRKKFGLPGMKVLQFAFSSDEKNEHLPHNFDKDFVVYTGTHDNDTLVNWLNTLTKEEKANLAEYFSNKRPEYQKLIALAMGSVAQTCILPIQDLLGLDGTNRMNTPGTLGDNWQWRMKNWEGMDVAGEYLEKITRLYNRQKSV